MALGREDWVRAALRDLATSGGVEGVRVEALARRLGVTKGSFYWHFRGRDDLLEALLAWYEQAGTREVIDAVEAGGDDDRLERLADLALAPVEEHDRAELALRAWASTDARAALTLERVDRQRVEYVSQLLEAAGLTGASARRRAEVFFRTLVGEFMLRSHGAAPMDEAVRHELLAMIRP